MKAWVISACAVSLWLSQPTTTTQRGDVFRSVDLRDWLGAAAEHEPGVEDAALRRIAGWSGGKLLRTLGTAGKEKPTEELNALLERAAVLHGDILLLRRESNESWPDAPDIAAGVSIIAKDGERIGNRTLDPHIQFARMIFRAMREPVFREPTSKAQSTLPWEEAHRRNPRIHQWYRTISTELAARHWLADLRPHLEDARRVLDDTAETMFDSACFSEAVASAQVQRALPPPLSPSKTNRVFDDVSERVNLGYSRSATPQTTGPARILLEEGFNLSEAERFYRDALKLDPGYAEARVRLARVLSLRGRPADAFALLQTPVESPDAFVRYYGALALGHAAEGTQKAEVARAAYERAAELFPRAQSPLLALMRLAREHVDDAGAKKTAAAFASLPADENYRLDPWWDYFDCHGRKRRGELERLWSLYRKKDRQ